MDQTVINIALPVSGLTVASGSNLDIETGQLLINNWSSVGATAGNRFDSGAANRRSSENTSAAIAHNSFYNPQGLVGTIETSGSATAFNTSSDPHLKTEFETFDALEMVAQAHDAGAVGRAGFLTDKANRYPMFDGQWMAVNQPGTGGDARTASKNASMDYGKRTPVHEEAIYQLLQRIEVLERDQT
jgi:hypothetical protein